MKQQTDHRDKTEYTVNNSFLDIKYIIVKKNNKEFTNSSYFYLKIQKIFTCMFGKKRQKR